MITINDLNEIEELLNKIDLGLVIKICLEVIFFFAVLYIAKWVFNFFFNKILVKINDNEIKRQYNTIKYLCVSIINVVIFLFFASNILGDLGIDMKPILATAGVVGVAVGFGGKRFVEDIISGLTILLSGQLRAGDYITIGNSTGTVEAVNLAMIKLRAYNGDVHYIRNGLVDIVINHTKGFSSPIVEVPVSYDSDIPYVISVLKTLGQEIRKIPEYGPYILNEPEIVAIDSFDSSAIILKVRFKTTTTEQWAIQRYFRIMIKQRFDELKISIPFNQLDVNLKKEMAETI